jgi:hypothetical protein
MCECFQIGGPFIAEDPDCPIHGIRSQGRDERLAEILRRVQSGDLDIGGAVEEIREEFC